jgi:hypothetical protein
MDVSLRALRLAILTALFCWPLSYCPFKRPARITHRSCELFFPLARVLIVPLDQTNVPDVPCRASKIETSLSRFVCLLGAVSVAQGASTSGSCLLLGPHDTCRLNRL